MKSGGRRVPARPSSTHRLAVAEELDFFPEFVAQGAEHAGFGVADARGFSGAERAEGKGDLARFLVDLRPGPRFGAIERVGDDPEHLRVAPFRVFARNAIVEAHDVAPVAGADQKADDGAENSGV